MYKQLQISFCNISYIRKQHFIHVTAQLSEKQILFYALFHYLCSIITPHRMKNVRLIIAIIGLLVHVQAASAAHDMFRLLDTKNGLFNNQVRFITQMQDGKILVYTEGMFNVYNGNQFEPLICDINHTLPLGMHNICTTYDGGDGLLWAKDFYRLYLIDMRTQRFYRDIRERFRASGITEPLNDFFLDNDKQAWLITESGKLYRYDWKNKAQEVYTPSREEIRMGIRVREVIQAGPFHLIFMNTGKMYCWEEKTSHIVNEDSRMASPFPSDFFRIAWQQQDDQHMLISISHLQGFLYSYNIYTREWREILRGKAVNDIKKNADGSFWLGCNYSLIHLSPQLEVLKETSHFTLTDGQTVRDFILSLLVDNRQGLWLGTGSTGILKAIPQEKYLNYYNNPGASTAEGKCIRSLCPYDETHLLVGTMQGMYLFDTADKTFATFRKDMSTTYCSDIKRDSKGNFWLSTRQGYYRLAGNTVERYDGKRIHNLKSETVRFSLPLANGNILLCNGLIDLYIYNPSDGTSVRLNEDYPLLNRSRAMSFAVEIRPGQLIIGSQNGIFGYETGKNKLEHIEWIKPCEKYTTKYNCAYHAGESIWIGTQNGLILHNLPHNETRRFSTEDGLPNNCIQGITADRDGNLWVSTSNGIGKILRKNDGSYSIARLDEEDGVQHGEMMEQSIAAMPDGHVYVGGMNGITDVQPAITEQTASDLKPVLVGLRIMNRSISNEGIYEGRQILPDGFSYTKELRLKHNENFIEMRFSALNYDAPQHTHYRYRLQGIDKEWNHTTSHTGICTATYTSLSPGKYTLQVETATGYSEWSEPEEWSIIVEPPLWKTWWAYALYTIVLFAIVYFIIELYIANKRSRMMAEQEILKRQKEQHLDELKLRFFTNISHEFRTPLALIITPLELLIRKTEHGTLKGELEKILSNAKDLLRLVNQLLDFRRLEQKGEQLKLAAVQIKPFIEECVGHFSEVAKEKRIELVCDCLFTHEDVFYLDAEKMIRVLNNLLSNALKFTPHNGIITVQATWLKTEEEDGKPPGIRICVSDTGVGISPDDLKNIFVRFYQSEQPQKTGLNTGSGIGLHLTKGYVDLHHGTIEAESTLGKGTKFTITLPYPEEPAGIAAPTAETAPGEKDMTEDGKPAEAEECDTQKITILVAEDNEQFRYFMKDLLKNEYQVLTAVDGKEGLAMARDYNPDLIISDVMMPNMDGYEFCRAIKTDVKCSHIPFILLTAKNSSESRSGAYEAGADSFIAKPFDIDVLSSRIRQLLEQREQRRDMFRKGIHIDPKEITITSLDEQLIQKALDFVEKNMGNPDYNVESLSADMGVERSSLYRKMSAIVGQTPSVFMRMVRLKRAAQLLESSHYSVQEISWMVGFNTPRYFSAYFKEMFGMTPSQYAQQKQKMP